MNELLKSLEGLYLEGKYNEARDLIIKNKVKFDKGLFHYNLGTVFIKSGDLAAGRLHLEKAIKFGFVNSKSLNNLEVVKLQLGVKDISNSGDFVAGLSAQMKLVPSDIFNILSLFMLTVIMFAIFKKWIVKRVIFIPLLILSLAPSMIYYGHLKGLDVGISLKEAKIFEGPSEVYEVKGELSSGAKVIISEIREGWFFISRPLFLSGWVKKENLGIF